MDQQMPPQPGRSNSLESWEQVIDAPMPGQRRRPAVITIAGVLLIVAGVYAAFAGLLILATGDGARIEGLGEDSSTLAFVVTLVLACLEVGSGALVLRSLTVGRMVGIVVAAIGIVAGVAAIGSPQGLVTIAIFGFVVFALVTNGEAFRRTSQR
jgi:hypothetical protein